MRKLEFFVTRDFEVNVRNVLDFFAADRAQVSSFSILAQQDGFKDDVTQQRCTQTPPRKKN